MTILGNIHKLELAIELERDTFYWRPWFHGFIERDPYLQDYSNCVWHAMFGWLWFDVTLNWQKGRCCWNQAWPSDPNPLIWFGVD